MGSLFLFLLALCAFAVSSRGLLSALTENVTVLSFNADYSRQAIKISKIYKVLAWSLLTIFLFITAIQTFWAVFFSF